MMRRIMYTIPRELMGFASRKSVGLLILAGILSAASGMMRANASSVIDSYLLWAWGGMSQNIDALQLSIWLITGLSFAIPYGYWLETDIATRSNSLYRYGSFTRWIISKLVACLLLAVIYTTIFYLTSFVIIYVSGSFQIEVKAYGLLGALFVLNILRFYRISLTALCCSQTRNQLTRTGPIIITIFETGIFIGGTTADKWMPSPIYMINSDWPVTLRIAVSVCICVILVAVWLKVMSVCYEKAGLNS
ncbi:MAG: hypothetical protein VB115_09785 [Christensenellaceae bacterium]|nr:hypothetical protein [Christensenellaceae bacterium]